MHYLKFWSLHDKPFGQGSAVRFFSGHAQREAIARLHTLVVGGIRCGVLLSPEGCGATTLLRHVAASHGFGDCAVEMLLTRGDQSNRGQVLADLAVALRAQAGPGSPMERIAAAIDASSRQSVRTVWLIDRCGEAATGIARSLIDRDRGLSVVMATSPSAGRRLAITLGYCPLRIELPPWSLTDTFDYVSASLHAAGGRRQPFADAAIVRMHEIGEGRVGIIASVAELALLVGAAHRVKQIGPELVELVQEELVRAA